MCVCVRGFVLVSACVCVCVCVCACLRVSGPVTVCDGSAAFWLSAEGRGSCDVCSVLAACPMLVAAHLFFNRKHNLGDVQRRALPRCSLLQRSIFIYDDHD